MAMLSQSDYLSSNSQIAWLLFSVGLSMKTSKSGVHMRSFALHSYCVTRTALADQFLLRFCNGHTDKFCKSKKFNAAHKE